MRLILLAAIAALTGCAGQGSAPVATAAMPTFAIPNPQRPGAKAPACDTLVQTLDGCTFHTGKDKVNRAKLPAAEGETWVAHASEPGIVEIRNAAPEAGADGAHLQVIEVIPTNPTDADIAVTFDKLTGEKGAQKVVERRRVNVMIHAS